MNDADIERNFSRLQAGFEAGDNTCALHAVAFAWYFKVAVPDWALAHVARGIRDWSSCETRTLDEALGVERPAGFRLDAAKRQYMHGGAILVGVNRLLEHQAYSDEVFEEIGAEWGIGKTAAKQIYHAELSYLEEKFPETYSQIMASRKKRKKPALRSQSNT